MSRKSSLAEEAAPRCTRCGSAHITKNGHNVCGSAQFFCKACGARRVLAPKDQRISAERRALILRAVATERLSLRGAQRVFGVSRNLIARWLEKKPRTCRS